MISTTAIHSSDTTLHHPRILCLHGGGSNADAFRLQCRGLLASLSLYFRLVFADAPFLCDAGPGMLPVYADTAPFRRWLRWLPEHEAVDADTAVEEIWYQLRTAMELDDEAGATGQWVALLGFSQGAKMSASLAFEQQVANERDGGGVATQWKFVVLLAGRAPLVSLSEASRGIKGLVGPEEISEGFEKIAAGEGDEKHVLRLPTLHVHGLHDAGLDLHRRMLNQYCDPMTATVVEWDGDHRVPVKTMDVKRVTDAILDIARKTGVIPRTKSSEEHKG